MDPRNRLQEYYKKQARLGKQAVTKGTDKFAKDYMLPTAKMAGSFTPVGPVIGLMDAKESYDKGNTGWALFGAGMEALPYTGKVIGKGISKSVNKLRNFDIKDYTKRAVDYMAGIDQGLADVIGNKRSFSSVFPITAKQKQAIITQQDEAWKKGNDFVSEWIYGKSKDLPRPEVHMRMDDMNTRRWYQPMGPVDKNSPWNRFNNVDNLILNTSSKQIENSSLPHYLRQYSKDNRRRIGGFNSGGEYSVTFRNLGPYYFSPRKINDVATHEGSHTFQKLRNKPDSNWGFAISKESSDYHVANDATEIGKRFEDAMVTPQQNRWATDPTELHSELMVARKDFTDLYEKAAKENNLDFILPGKSYREDAIQRLQNPDDEDIKWLIQRQGLDKFFKPETPFNVRAGLIRALPVGTGAALIPRFTNNNK